MFRVDNLARVESDERTVLILDEDPLVREGLAEAFAALGLEPILVNTCKGALALIKRHAPAFAVIDTKLSTGSGLEVLEKLREARSDCRAVVLTAYGTLSWTVAAVKAGAIDVLPKPADPDLVSRVLLGSAHDDQPLSPKNLMSPARVRWECIMQVYEQCGRNVSETARRLKMHRRTLQRILWNGAPQ
jgi:two-component system response regulator RegA